MLIAGGLGAAIAVGLFQFVESRSNADTQQEMLAELRNISAALGRGGPAGAPQQAQAPAIQEPPKDLRLAIDDSASLGRADAKLVMIEFTDFDCPFCARYAQTTKDQIVKEYVDTGKMRYVFRHMPLRQLHPNAHRESEAAECARRQDKFWQMYPRLFESKQTSSEADLRAHASAIGLNAAAFEKCLAGEASARVTRDLNEGARAGIMGTPMFFIGKLDENGRVQIATRIVGAEPIDKFRGAIEQLLAAQ
jgi:protein-disulfide isomerase